MSVSHLWLITPKWDGYYQMDPPCHQQQELHLCSHPWPAQVQSAYWTWGLHVHTRWLPRPVGVETKQAQPLAGYATWGLLVDWNTCSWWQCWCLWSGCGLPFMSGNICGRVHYWLAFGSATWSGWRSWRGLCTCLGWSYIVVIVIILLVILETITFLIVKVGQAAVQIMGRGRCPMW